ncbi:MAG: hypothetical protein ABW134_11745 [Candidatus Thiodiazotropha endolucinida]
MAGPEIAAAVISAVGTAYAAKKSRPKVGEQPEVPLTDDKKRKTAAERELQKRYGHLGRAGTKLTDNNTLG